MTTMTSPGRLTCSMPASKSCRAWKMWAGFWVKIVPDMPYFTELLIRIASSYPSQVMTDRTGPKTSSWASSLSHATWSRTVG